MEIYTLRNLASPVDVKNQLVASVDEAWMAKQRFRIGGDLNYNLNQKMRFRLYSRETKTNSLLYLLAGQVLTHLPTTTGSRLRFRVSDSTSRNLIKIQPIHERKNVFKFELIENWDVNLRQPSHIFAARCDVGQRVIWPAAYVTVHVKAVNEAISISSGNGIIQPISLKIHVHARGRNSK